MAKNVTFLTTNTMVRKKQGKRWSDRAPVLGQARACAKGAGGHYDGLKLAAACTHPQGKGSRVRG